jgi:hypothetical protein
VILTVVRQPRILEPQRRRKQRREIALMAQTLTAVECTDRIGVRAGHEDPLAATAAESRSCSSAEPLIASRCSAPAYAA